MLSGLVPFHSLRDTEIWCKVIQGERPAMPTNASELGISDGLWQLLVRCWNRNYFKRPQINEVLRHLCQDLALGLLFPPSPSNVPRAPSCESVFDSGTQRYGKCSWLRLVCWCAYSSIADIFVTANAEPQSEGMFGTTLWTTGLNPSPIRMSTVPHARKS